MAFKMKGFNPGNGTGMGGAFNKASNDPPPKKDNEIKYSTNLAKWEEAKNKNRTWRDSQKREELVNKNEPSGGYDEHGNALGVMEDGQQYIGSAPAFTELISGPAGKAVKGVQALSKGKGIIHNAKNLLKNFKFGKTTKVKPPTTPPTLPKSKIPHYGDMKSTKDIDKVTNIITQKGKLWDKAYTANPKNFFNKDMFKEVQGFGGKGPGTPGYRRVVEMSKEGLPTQRMWQSTSLGNKKFADGKGTKDAWLPMEGFGTLHDPTHGIVKNWAVKGKGWDKGYNTKLYDKDFLGHFVNKYLPKK